MNEQDDTRKAELDPETLELRWENTPGGFGSNTITGIGAYVLTADEMAESYTLELFPWARNVGASILDDGIQLEEGKRKARDHARTMLREIIGKLTEPTKLPRPGVGIDPDTFELTWNRREDGSRGTNIVPGVGRYVVEPVTGTIEGFCLVWYPWEGSVSACLNDREDLGIAMERAKRHARDHLRQINARAKPPAEDCQDERAPNVELTWKEEGPLLVSNTLPGVGYYTIGPVQPSGRGAMAYDPVLRSLARHATRGESELLADRVSLNSAKTLATMHAICELARQRGRPADIPEAFKLAPDALKFGADLSASMKLALEGGKSGAPSQPDDPRIGEFVARAADLERQAADIAADARARGINVERTAELSRRALEKARQTLGYVEHPTLDTIRRFREALEKTETGMIQTSVIIAWLELLSDNLETHEMLRRKAGK